MTVKTALLALAMVSVLPCWAATTTSSSSRYVDHDTAVNEGGIGNYVTRNEEQAYQDRVALQDSLKRQLASNDKTVSLPSDQSVVFFKEGSSDLTRDGQMEVTRVAQQLQNNPSLVAVVNGYTDSKGEESDNQQLSKARADTVKNQLQDLGVKSRQIQTQALGESEPIASNQEQPQLNRRAEILVEDFKQVV